MSGHSILGEHSHSRPFSVPGLIGLYAKLDLYEKSMSVSLMARLHSQPEEIEPPQKCTSGWVYDDVSRNIKLKREGPLWTRPGATDQMIWGP